MLHFYTDYLLRVGTQQCYEYTLFFKKRKSLNFLQKKFKMDSMENALPLAVMQVKARGNLLYLLGDYTAALNHYRAAMDPLREYKAAHASDLDVGCVASELLVSLLLNVAACALAEPAEGHADAAKQAAGTALEVLPQCIPRHRISSDEMQASDQSDRLISLAAKGYFRRGVAHTRLGLLDEARADLDQATQLQPDSSAAKDALKRLDAIEAKRDAEAFAPALALGDAETRDDAEASARPWCWATRSATPSTVAATAGLDALALKRVHLFGRPQDVPVEELPLLSEGGVTLDFGGRAGRGVGVVAVAAGDTVSAAEAEADRTDVSPILVLRGTRGLAESSDDIDYWEVRVAATTTAQAADVAAAAPLALRLGVQGATLAVQLARADDGVSGAPRATALGDGSWSVAIPTDCADGALVVGLLWREGVLRWRCAWRPAAGPAGEEVQLFASSAALPADAEEPARPCLSIASPRVAATVVDDGASSATSLLLRDAAAAAGFVSLVLTLATPFVHSVDRSSAAAAAAAEAKEATAEEVLRAFGCT